MPFYSTGSPEMVSPPSSQLWTNSGEFSYCNIFASAMLINFFCLGVNTSSGLPLTDDYSKGSPSGPGSGSSLPAFNRIPAFHTSTPNHRSAPYSIPPRTVYSDWQYSESPSSLQYSLMSPQNNRNRPPPGTGLSAAASLSASKFLFSCCLVKKPSTIVRIFMRKSFD